MREQWILENFALMVVSFLALALTAFGLGLTLMVAGHRFPLTHQLAPLVTRPLWFVSGIYFVPARVSCSPKQQSMSQCHAPAMQTANDLISGIDESTKSASGATPENKLDVPAVLSPAANVATALQ